MIKLKKTTAKIGMLITMLSVLGGCAVHSRETSAGAEKEAETAVETDGAVHREETGDSEQRIIAVSAAACDIMDRLEIQLIGKPAVTVSAVSARYKDLPEVGTPMSPDMEIIKSLNPTDVIGPDTLAADLQSQYDRIGVKATFINLRSVEGLYDSVAYLGEKYDRQKQAQEMIEEYTVFMEMYRTNHEDKPVPRVLVLMGLPGDYLVATNQSYAGSLVELAGGVNVFRSDTQDFLNVNTEEIYQTNPDVIIRTAHGLPEEAQEMFQKEFAENDIWKHFDAVKNNRVYDVDYMLFGMSATFDYPEALAYLENCFYGE